MRVAGVAARPPCDVGGAGESWLAARGPNRAGQNTAERHLHCLAVDGKTVHGPRHSGPGSAAHRIRERAQRDINYLGPAA